MEYVLISCLCPFKNLKSTKFQHLVIFEWLRESWLYVQSKFQFLSNCTSIQQFSYKKAHLDTLSHLNTRKKIRLIVWSQAEGLWILSLKVCLGRSHYLFRGGYRNHSRLRSKFQWPPLYDLFETDQNSYDPLNRISI